MSPASVHDVNYLKDIKEQIGDCTLIGDRGYLPAEIQLNLFETCNIRLNTPMRKNQHNYKKQPYIFRKSRNMKPLKKPDIEFERNWIYQQRILLKYIFQNFNGLGFI